MAIYNEFGNLKNLDSSFGDLAKNALNKRDKFDKRNVRYDRQKQITRDILGIELYQFLCKNASTLVNGLQKLFFCCHFNSILYPHQPPQHSQCSHPFFHIRLLNPCKQRSFRKGTSLRLHR